MRSFAECGVTSLEDFRARKFGGAPGAVPDDPYGDVFLVIDNYAALTDDTSSLRGKELLQAQINKLITDGRSYGIHAMASVGKNSNLHPHVRDAWPQRIELRLPAESDTRTGLKLRDLAKVPKQGPAVDYAQDFFDRPAFLTVSGQLEAEAFACALSKVYTFGPTFRAENSNTSRHANEFWMIEPEMAFTDLRGNMDVAEEIVKYLVRDVRSHCAEDLELFAKFVDKELLPRLDFVLERPFQRISYTEAVELLRKSGEQFEFPVEYGLNLQSEHERWLTEKHFKSPITVLNYPKEIKPFYMRLNDDGKTVAAIDLLVPGIGEIVGGSQREERLDVLEGNLRRHKMDLADYKWYLDLRRYGTVPHAGFGLGFERMMMFVTGVANIRDVIPFARTPGSAEF
jgi:asparaginyl-tRNA synthetase